MGAISRRLTDAKAGPSAGSQRASLPGTTALNRFRLRWRSSRPWTRRQS